ncbi:MAG: SDR family oxidoreductase [Deltaproteobacteria bacterium]|nr:SDR family oxidoreductase [Deltaproteobacteria bacterium]
MEEISYGMKDKVVLVTGGSRGIGLEIVRRLIHHEKARVAICGRKQDGLEAARSLLGEQDRLLALPAHIAREDDVERLFDAVEQRFGRLDVLINNVGMNIMTPSLAETETNLWQKIIDTNLTGTFLCSRRAAALMKAQGGGKIVAVSSIAARKAAPAMGIYGIAKAAVEMMTKVLAVELAPFNIQVNALAPSMVRTDFSKPFWSSEPLYREIVRAIPLGRIAEPIDVVHPVLFLASRGSDFITGHTLMVDGGASAL